MTTESITIRVDVRAAQAFNTVSDAERRQVEALLSLRLLEAVQTEEPLEVVMRRISQNVTLQQEQEHATGHARFPVMPGEFDGWDD